VHSFSVISAGQQQTEIIAQVLAPCLGPGDVILLKGQLATGKTTFVQALAAALGSHDQVTSPTFMLAQFYQTRAPVLLHIDAYRLSGVHEYRDLGLDDYIDDVITVIEWGEKLINDFPCHLLLEINLDPGIPEKRMMTFSSSCQEWLSRLPELRSDIESELRTARSAS